MGGCSSFYLYYSFSPLYVQELFFISLFLLLHNKQGCFSSTSKEAKALGISSGYPLLRIESVIHDVKNTITNLCRRLCIGDKFKFII